MNRVFITNWSSKKMYGPGSRLGIMAAPRVWEKGDGSVPLFIPYYDTVLKAKAGTVSWKEYEQQFREHVWQALQQGDPGAEPSHWVLCADGSRRALQDGDTLLCCCGRAVAAAGECHRTWVARILQELGWQVVLDGVLTCPPPTEKFSKSPMGT